MERLTERTADGILVKENYEKETLKPCIRAMAKSLIHIILTAKKVIAQWRS